MGPTHKYSKVMGPTPKIFPGYGPNTKIFQGSGPDTKIFQGYGPNTKNIPRLWVGGTGETCFHQMDQHQLAQLFWNTSPSRYYRGGPLGPNTQGPQRAHSQPPKLVQAHSYRRGPTGYSGGALPPPSLRDQTYRTQAVRAVLFGDRRIAAILRNTINIRDSPNRPSLPPTK